MYLPTIKWSFHNVLTAALNSFLFLMLLKMPVATIFFADVLHHFNFFLEEISLKMKKRQIAKKLFCHKTLSSCIFIACQRRKNCNHTKIHKKSLETGLCGFEFECCMYFILYCNTFSETTISNFASTAWFIFICFSVTFLLLTLIICK